ncbi:MAG: FkbM family methyltransferase [Proteobacteria bacterium]|nr:FkbM family methyltransferase [Pseudomonadota bacterium]
MTSFRFGDLPWRAKASYVAHAFKAAVKQHHGWMRPLLSRYIDSEGVILDIGGHAGQYAKLFARMARHGRVYSFEPSSYACSILRLAIRINGFSNIHLVAKGLSDQTGSQILNTPLKDSGTFRYGLAHMGEIDRAGPYHHQEVPVTTIDRFAADEGLRRLDFIKMDVQGWEMRILEGGTQTITRYRPVMLVELVDEQLSQVGDSLKAAWGLLESWGYRAAICIDGKDLTPLEAPRDGDIFWLPD